MNATTESLCENTTFAYGSVWPSINRLTSASWGTAATPNCTPMPAWVEAYAYNGPGAVTAKTLSMNTESLTASYTYDNEGKPTSVKYLDTKVESGAPIVLCWSSFGFHAKRGLVSLGCLRG